MIDKKKEKLESFLFDNEKLINMELPKLKTISGDLDLKNLNNLPVFDLVDFKDKKDKVPTGNLNFIGNEKVVESDDERDL